MSYPGHPFILQWRGLSYSSARDTVSVFYTFTHLSVLHVKTTAWYTIKFTQPRIKVEIYSFEFVDIWLTVSIGIHVNAHMTEYMCFNQRGNISTQNGSSLKLVDKFTYLGGSVSSTETDINTRLAKAWTAINRQSVIWKSDLTNKMKYSFFQAAVMSILLYGYTI